MVKLTVRVLLLLSVLAMGRFVVGGFLQSEERSQVIVVLMHGGECASETSAPDRPKEN
jgi:hypothetical protein